MGRLTTHILDTAQGRPAAGVRVELFALEGESATRLREVRTNADGRCDAPLLADAALVRGRYRLRFHIGEYFRGQGLPLADPPFVDVVPVEFGIADAAAHYHVPLLVSPWSFATYRGS
jgi:5-hydroxyisourate hydrolase